MRFHRTVRARNTHICARDHNRDTYVNLYMTTEEQYTRTRNIARNAYNAARKHRICILLNRHTVLAVFTYHIKYDERATVIHSINRHHRTYSIRAVPRSGRLTIKENPAKSKEPREERERDARRKFRFPVRFACHGVRRTRGTTIHRYTHAHVRIYTHV